VTAVVAVLAAVAIAASAAATAAVGAGAGAGAGAGVCPKNAVTSPSPRSSPAGGNSFSGSSRPLAMLSVTHAGRTQTLAPPPSRRFSKCFALVSGTW